MATGRTHYHLIQLDAIPIMSWLSEAGLATAETTALKQGSSGKNRKLSIKAFKRIDTGSLTTMKKRCSYTPG